MVAILILNWNGWEDTIECLKSVFRMSYKDYYVILGDNGSTNDSRIKISEYCKSIGKEYEWHTIEQPHTKQIIQEDIILLDLKYNNGFAKGNNLMIKYAWNSKPDYFLLLNNDTEVVPNFLQELVNYQKQNTQVKILTPLIRYFYEKNRIWNAGGNIIWGVRKYHFADSVVPNYVFGDFISCTFITGCALLCTPSVLKEDHTLFTEAFFHGEEDFELALRMKKEKIKMGCYTPSVIYHKVGRSSGSIGKKIGLTYCYFLNRFINLRHNLNSLSFYTFLIVYFPYVVRLLSKAGLTIKDSIKFYYKVVKESHRLEGVSYEKFCECAKLSQI